MNKHELRLLFYKYAFPDEYAEVQRRKKVLCSQHTQEKHR